ncbi:MAG: hypothetical protein DMG85_21810 [Acidobacteria bacterium]|nr:MAG: hypothetical protein DMG85_21810 [Acidobacteriota bacterium]TLY46216.1 MAG: hypothetical protein E6K59_01585 [Nitrospirota bacterium]
MKEAALRVRVFLCLALLLAGCQYYEEFRSIKGDADIKEEIAEMRKAYRLCLQKYEGDTAAVKERCAPYAQSIQEFERRAPAAK